MGDGFRAAHAGARLEFQQYNRSRVVVVLAVLEAITFLVLVSLFALTGSKAPTALVDLDGGPVAASFIQHLKDAHNSFDLRPMGIGEANRLVDQGELVAIITIPENFSADITAGGTVLLPVTVDNVDTDLTDDIKEAVPSTITSFGRDLQFPGVRLVANESDVYPDDTGYVPYLIVSALALNALVVCGILGAMAITHEFEEGTIVQWQLAPVGPGWLLIGKLLAACAVGTVANAVAAAVVIFGYRVPADHLFEVAFALGLAVIIFTALGAAVGTLIKRTLPVAALFFGLALPFYLVSGAIEPVRFDGETLYTTAHMSPVYSVVTLVENGFHDLRVAPETIRQSVIVLVLWTIVALLIATALLHRKFARR